jgi:hypothetical protein
VAWIFACIVTELQYLLHAKQIVFRRVECPSTCCAWWLGCFACIATLTNRIEVKGDRCLCGIIFDGGSAASRCLCGIIADGGSAASTFPWTR